MAAKNLLFLGLGSSTNVYYLMRFGLSVAIYVPTACRTFTVPEDDRMYTVPSATRTFTVPEDDRTFTVECE